MKQINFNMNAFKKMPVIGILRDVPYENIEKIMPIFESSGFTNIEVTMNTPGVGKIITKLCASYPNLNVGAGTVCNMEDLDRALKAGASFIVTPIISENVIQFCVKNNIPVFPGAYTPTEIYLADRLGATAIKVFPATQLGTRYIKDVLGPLNTLKLLPTGGITTSNIKSFFEAGAFGLGMGGSLFDKEIIKNQDFEALEKHFIKITEIVKPFT